MANYQNVRTKLTNKQSNKLKASLKNKKKTILRINTKNIQDEEFPHELFLTARQLAKIKKCLC